MNALVRDHCGSVFLGEGIRTALLNKHTTHLHLYNVVDLRQYHKLLIGQLKYG
jgi:hypothetical protein